MLPASSESAGGPSQRRMRTWIACDQCRNRKDKCDSEGVFEQCDGCRRRRISCTYTTKRRRLDANHIPPVKRVSQHESSNTRRVSWAITGNGQGVPSLVPAELPNTSHLLALLSDYFLTCHQGLYYSFVHEPTLVSLVTSGNTPRTLLLALCASVLRLGRDEPSAESLEIADAWALEARRSLLDHVFDRFETTDIMVALLLTRYNMHRAAETAGWLIHGLTVRMSIALKVNNESVMEVNSVRGNADYALWRIGAETRRRLAWAVFVQDSFINAARSDVPQIHPANIRVHLPSTEDAFSTGHSSITRGLNDRLQHDEGTVDESAYLIQLSAIRLRVLKYLRGTSVTPPWMHDSEYGRLEESINRFVEDLPAHMAFHSASIFQRKRTGRLVAFLTLHVFLRQIQCDICQVEGVLRRLPIGTEISEAFMKRCYRSRLINGLGVCDMIAEALPHRGIALDPFMEHAHFRHRKEDDAPEVTENRVVTAFETGLACLRRLSYGSAICKRYLASTCTSLARGGYEKLLLPREIGLYATALVSRAPSPDLGKLNPLATIERALNSPSSSAIPLHAKEAQRSAANTRQLPDDLHSDDQLSIRNEVGTQSNLGRGVTVFDSDSFVRGSTGETASFEDQSSGMSSTFQANAFIVDESQGLGTTNGSLRPSGELFDLNAYLGIQNDQAAETMDILWGMTSENVLWNFDPVTEPHMGDVYNDDSWPTM